jgi:hypothetical protein
MAAQKHSGLLDAFSFAVILYRPFGSSVKFVNQETVSFPEGEMAMRRILLGSFPFLLLCAVMASAQSGGATGTWDASLTSPQGSFNVKLILKQEGEKVTGVVRGQRGDTPVEGTNNGKEITLKYTIKFQDNDLPITLTGAYEAASIKGSADYGGMAQGEFSAKRAAADAGPAPAKPPANSAPANNASDISGEWLFQVETGAGTGSPNFTFKQEGEKLTGQYKGAFGEAPLTGTFKDGKIAFTIKVDAQGQQLTINYTGTLEKDGTMKGAVDLGEVGSGTWTGKRK